MKNLIVGDKATVERLAERLKRANSHAEYQRIQCVLIRATLGSSAAEIAQLLGWSTATVYAIHSRWAKEGDALFDLRRRGGRRHENLSIEQEAALLTPFVQRAEAGGMLTVFGHPASLRGPGRPAGGAVDDLPAIGPAWLAQGRAAPPAPQGQRRRACGV